MCRCALPSGPRLIPPRRQEGATDRKRPHENATDQPRNRDSLLRALDADIVDGLSHRRAAAALRARVASNLSRRLPEDEDVVTLRILLARIASAHRTPGFDWEEARALLRGHLAPDGRAKSAVGIGGRATPPAEGDPTRIVEAAQARLESMRREIPEGLAERIEDAIASARSAMGKVPANVVGAHRIMERVEAMFREVERTGRAA